MSVFAIVHPTGLLGQELREQLDQRTELWQELRLLTQDETEAGTLTEVRGSAAMVQKLEPESLRGVEAVFLCGPIEVSRRIVEGLDPGTVAVLLSPEATTDDGTAAVEGVNAATLAERGERVLVSPHPGVILLSHLASPLTHLGLIGASASLVMPASMAGKEGLDELYEQSRAIVALVQERPQAIFGRQLAFNLYPDKISSAALASQLRAVLGDELLATAHTAQAGVFHGLAATVHLRFSEDPGPAEIREALAASPFVEPREDDEAPSPIDSPAREEILIGHLQADGRGGYWVWAVMDNLTRGGALNAIGIAKAALGR